MPYHMGTTALSLVIHLVVFPFDWGSRVRALVALLTRLTYKVTPPGSDVKSRGVVFYRLGR